MKQIAAVGVTLNRDKCLFGQEKLKFLGHVIDKHGIAADPDKLSAILQMKAPTNVPELRRFMGMVNQFGKFSPSLATISQPLRELLSKNTVWVWGPTQISSFDAVKKELTKPPVLALYDPKATTKVSTDASSFGIGAVLLQKTENGWRAVAFDSRSMTEVERRYAQIEKEAGLYLGMREICRLLTGSNIHSGDRPQTFDPTVQYQAVKQLTATSPQIPTTNGQIRL